MIRQKTSRGKVEGRFGVGWIPPTNVGAIHDQKGWAKLLLEEATKAVQLETSSSWQHESPFREELELLREGSDLRLEGSLVRPAFQGWEKAGDWADFLENNDK